jgi:serine protease Do
MTREARILLMVLFLGAGVVGGLLLGKAVDPRVEAASAAPRSAPAAPAALANLQDSFNAAAEFAMPSVVHISTPGGGAAEWWAPQGVGSGVIVSADGHVLTNNHVAELAQGRAGLRVRLSDGRELAAKVVGTDPETDLAVLKVVVPKDAKILPASFADSDRVRVGDWCLAIGSPFGYNHTVTAGIVSAKHRRAQFSMPYQDFLQTDAAINPGNSGGALVSVRGELIGINTAIVSGSQGNDGVGLAISANLARVVKDALVKEGRVRRGYLGVRPLDFDQTLVDALKQDYGFETLAEVLDFVGLKEPKGVLLYNVEPGTPAAKAGLRDRDVLVEFNGKPVAGQSDLFFRVAEVAPGSKVAMKVLRDKQAKEFTVELGERQPIDLRRPARRR